MSKKGPLGKAEKFYIREKYKEESVDSIAETLDRPLRTVKRHIYQCKKDENEAIENEFNVGSQFGVRNGSIVMTQNASEMGDAIRGQKTVTSRQSKCTTTTSKLND